MHRQALLQVVRDFIIISFVCLWKDDCVDASPASAHDLFLDPADWQYLTGERNFTRHRQIVSNGLAHCQGQLGRYHCDASGRTVLRRRAFWHMHVNVMLVKVGVLWIDPEQMRSGYGVRDLAALFHRVSKIASDLDATTASCLSVIVQSALDGLCFNVQCAATHRRVRQAHHNAIRQGVLVVQSIAGEDLLSDVVLQFVSGDQPVVIILLSAALLGQRRSLVLGNDLQCQLSSDLVDVLGQTAHASFSGVPSCQILNGVHFNTNAAGDVRCMFHAVQWCLVHCSGGGGGVSIATGSASATISRSCSIIIIIVCMPFFFLFFHFFTCGFASLLYCFLVDHQPVRFHGFRDQILVGNFYLFRQIVS
mmetsp:Transcript_19828/g.56053  ORF Transcript_19828/g.56053 Transcript_19828/m.56053 type:complete len:364 (-) Transcript_19828:2030-3121(-)